MGSGPRYQGSSACDDACGATEEEYFAEGYDRAVCKHRVSTVGGMREDRALSSALIRPICKVPPPPLPPPKRRLFPPAGGMRSHSIRSSWRRASRERWSSSILDRIRHQRSYLGMAALRITDAPETSGSGATNSFSDPVRCVSHFTHLAWSSPYRNVNHVAAIP